MRKIIFGLLIIFLLFNISGYSRLRKFEKFKYPKLRNFKIPEIKKLSIENGIKIRVMKSGVLPVVNLIAVFKGGSLFDGDKVGLSSITASMLRIGGIKGMKGEELDKYLDSNGISISIDSSLEYFTVNMTCLIDDLDKGIDILSRILIQPAFEESKLKEIKSQLASSIARRNDEPNTILNREFDILIYGKKSPLAAVMEYEHLDKISLNDVKNHYKKFFYPDNMLTGIIGNIDDNLVKTLFNKYFNNWKKKNSRIEFPGLNYYAYNNFKVGYIKKSNLNQSYIAIGHLGIKEDLKQEAKILVFNSIFSEGMDSRLFTNVRTKKGLTYGIGGGIITPKFHRGKVYFYTFTKTKTTIDSIKAIFDEINRIRKERVSEEELSNAKDYYLNAFIFKYSSAYQILYNEIIDEFYGYEKGYLKRLIDEVKKVSVNDIYEIANKYLHPEKMIILVVGNIKDAEKKLSVFGKVKDIDITIKRPLPKEKIPKANKKSLILGNKIIRKSFYKNYRGYLKAKTFYSESTVKIKTPHGEMSVERISKAIYPDKFYDETNIGMMKMIYIINGNKGIRKMGDKKVALDETVIKKDKFGDLRDIFINRKKYRLQYLYDKVIKGKSYHVIYVTDKNKNWEKLYINKKTLLIEIQETNGELMGKSGILRYYKRNFKKINNIYLPMKVEGFINGEKLLTININKAKFNERINPELFKLD